MSSFGCAYPSTCPYGGKCDYGCSIIRIPPKTSPLQEKAKPKFLKGDRVNLVDSFSGEVKKKGTIHRLRNDDWEERYNHPKGIFFYYVKYDDDSCETYEHEKNLLPCY